MHICVCISITSSLILLFFIQGFTYIDPSLLDSLGTSSSDQIKKPVNEEDNFQMQKKQKHISRIYKSTSTVIQSEISDSKSPTDQNPREVTIIIDKLFVMNILSYFYIISKFHMIIIHSAVILMTQLYQRVLCSQLPILMQQKLKNHLHHHTQWQ